MSDSVSPLANIEYLYRLMYRYGPGRFDLSVLQHYRTTADKVVEAAAAVPTLVHLDGDAIDRVERNYAERRWSVGAAASKNSLAAEEALAAYATEVECERIRVHSKAIMDGNEVREHLRKIIDAVILPNQSNEGPVPDDVILPNQRKIDVKSTSYKNGDLIVDPKSHFLPQIDAFVLVIGDYVPPYEYRIAGWYLAELIHWHVGWNNRFPLMSAVPQTILDSPHLLYCPESPSSRYLWRTEAEERALRDKRLAFWTKHESSVPSAGPTQDA